MSNINSTIRVKDGQGNINTVYPITTINNVDGLQTALNAKQGTISDLPTIRSGATAGATAVQPSSLVDIVNNGAKNLCPNNAKSTGIFTVNEDGTVIANGSSGASAQNLVLGEFTLKAGKTYRMHSNNTVTGSTYFIGLAKLPQYSTIYTEFGSPTFTPEEDTAVQAYLRVQANQTVNNVKFEPMVCLEIDWQASQQYVPHALPNYELTKKLDGISNKSAASGGTDVSLCTTGEKYNWNRKQNALILGDYSLDLNSLTFTQSSSGMYYSNEIYVGDFTQIFSAMAYDFASLKTTDNVNIMISTDRKKIVILSNVNSFNAGAALELQIVGI